MSRFCPSPPQHSHALASTCLFLAQAIPPSKVLRGHGRWCKVPNIDMYCRQRSTHGMKGILIACSPAMTGPC
ncbi:hypothetical protein BGZ63DRAFT_5635 [Mariannaea sp. PMI_226]|nr:hypothetical protein BGZ63DRAFT_5635 [Mariannaea sp. PMI_226]